MSVEGSDGHHQRSAEETQVAQSLSGELHAVYDRILETPLPQSFGRLIGELVFRDLYPFSTDFEPKFRWSRPK